MKILVISEDDKLAKDLAEKLEDHTIINVSSVDAAITVFLAPIASRIDLVVAQTCVRNGGDGWIFLEEISRRKISIKVGLFCFSCFENESITDQAYQHGAVFFIGAPFSIEKILDAIFKFFSTQLTKPAKGYVELDKGERIMGEKWIEQFYQKIERQPISIRIIIFLIVFILYLLFSTLFFPLKRINKNI